MNNYVTAEEKVNQDNKKYMFLKEYKVINEAEIFDDLLEIRVSEKNYFNDMTLALDITPDQVLESKWQFIITDPGAKALDLTGLTKSYISKFIDEYIKNEFEASANGVGLLPKAEFNSQTRKFKPFYYCILKSLTLDMKLPNSISDVLLMIDFSLRDFEKFDPQTYKLKMTEFKTLKEMSNGCGISLVENRYGMVELRNYSHIEHFKDMITNLNGYFNFEEFKSVFLGDVEFTASDLIVNFINNSPGVSNKNFIWFKKFVSELSSKTAIDLYFEITGLKTFAKHVIIKINITAKSDLLPVSHTCFNILDIPNYDTETIALKKFNCWVANFGGGNGVA
ncbi:hypothetical protein HK099_006115 [Clydaea vesicula]|uniref:HECT domain-containing protein n=1 Tax=Clydaea vesicula TaxID=447962 RepID=A0AAD5U1L2_9FUNG|nr:hypothetical protein HK099_006115 [Clydaea vesicula]